MQEIINQFIDAMRASGCGPLNPSEIIADDKKHRISIDGDRAKQKTGVFQLKINDGFGVGWFKNYRIGETVSWHSRATGKNYTPAQRKEWADRIEREKALARADHIRASDAAAARAKSLWDRATAASEHPYAERKHVPVEHPVRVLRGLLVIPVYNASNKLRSLQFIADDGAKRFLTDGDKSGCFLPIGSKTDDRSRILICEGWATGSSLRAATGLTVIVAFDAGNILSVAEVFRGKYPESEIIICADNDAFTLRQKFRPADIDVQALSGNDPFWQRARDDGNLINTGIEKGRAAAAKIGARCVWPEFNDVRCKPTDFNDLHCAEGLDAVRAQVLRESVVDDSPLERIYDDPDTTPEPPAWISEIPFPEDSEAVAQIELYDVTRERRDAVTDWKNQLSRKEDGSIRGSSIQNALLYLSNHEILSKIFCYDEFCRQKYVYQCPPWEETKKFKPRPVRDNDITMLSGFLERFGFNLPTSVIQKVLDASVRNNPRNPAQEYFKSLRWDGVKRLDTWLQRYCEASYENEAYVSAVGRKWLTASVARVMQPGTKFDHMLILEGEQGTMKSTLLRELATVHGKAYFDDTIRVHDLGNAASIPKLQGVLIVEIAELAGIRNKDVDELKSAITCQSDRTVLKYQNEPSEFPRQFIFAGTVNPTDGYLNDPTGNRRFWPVRVGRMDIDGIKRDREQLWAEAVVSYEAGETLYLSEGIAREAARITELRSNEHPWFDDLRSLCAGRDTVEKEDIWTRLEIKDRTKRTNAAARDIVSIMTRLGFIHTRRRINGERSYVWKRKEVVEEIPL